LSNKKPVEKNENKIILSMNPNKDKSSNNKFKIKPLGGLIKKERNEFRINENEKKITKKNYSESPTIKKSFFITDNLTNNDYSTKSNANNYKRNNSYNNLNTIPNTNYCNNQFNEETIELIIPTPYPKNVVLNFKQLN